MMFTIKKLSLLFVSVMCIAPLLAQQDTLQKRVEVVKPYDPSISDAYKINYLPVISDTAKITPRYDYKTRYYHYNTLFSVKPISYAKMVGEPLKELYKSYIKVGMGNYTTPLVEASYHNLRSKNYSYGVSGRFLGSYGKVKLENNEKVSLGYNDSYLNIYGKRIWSDYVFGGKINYSHLSGNYYGYNTDIPLANVLPIEKQSGNSIGGSLFIKSTHVDSAHVNYRADLNYNYFGDKYNFGENNLNIKSSFDKFWQKERIGVDLGVKAILPNAALDSGSTAEINFRPWISTFGDNWSVKAGISVFYYNTPRSSKTLFFPFGNIQYNLANNFLVPYITIDGGIKTYSYMDLLKENLYVTPGTFVEPENHKLHLRGGFKGVFSQVLSYNFSASYSIIDNMHFFINDFAYNTNGSSFKVVYDDVEMVNISGMVSITPSEKLSFDLLGNYYNYKVAIIDKPYNKPDWDVSFVTRYNMQDKILFGVDIVALSSRYAFDKATSNSIVMDGAMNITLNAEYRYTKVLSFFTKLSNMTAQKYQMWNQYPSQRFGIMIGASYKL